MTRIPLLALPIFMSSILTSSEYGAHAMHTICGLVTDEKGDCVNGADVLIESAMDRRHTVTSGDGSFYSDICIGGSFDEVRVKALFGPKQGFERINAHCSYMTVDIVLREV